MAATLDNLKLLPHKIIIMAYSLRINLKITNYTYPSYFNITVNKS